MGEICSALQYAHENGVVHRDIKPENVLVDASGRVRVVDFGLAKLLDRRPGEVTLTQSQQSLGAWHYMAPEQYERPQSVDHRADIYSLGVVFYELLTGQVPVGRFDLPSQRIAVDVRVDEVVLKALAREPEKRWQAASEVKSKVDDIGRGPALATAASQVSRSSALKLVALVLVVLGGLAGMAMLFLLIYLTFSVPQSTSSTEPLAGAGSVLSTGLFILGPSLAGVVAALAAVWWFKRRSQSRWPAFALLALAALLFVVSVGALMVSVWSGETSAGPGPAAPLTPTESR